tara:strand:+ start:140 stop:508 length:369 start_codon:yes stop_codon:yes gene_type:complete
LYKNPKIMISYQIFIILQSNINLIIGKLGLFNFPKGLYIYTGSSKKNINQRIARHCRSKEKLFWHIDYFLENKNTNIIKIKKSSINECVLNKKLYGKTIVPGFGSSDCNNKCKSHLKFFLRS